MRRMALLCLGFVLCSTLGIYAQDKTISGRVIDIKGDPIIGATVSIKGASGSGTVTDANGNYTLQAPANAIIVITAFGFQTQEASANNINGDIVLSDALDTVVVTTNYGQVIDKRRTTGAISGVSGKTFENLPVQSFDRGIQGRLAGVQVNALNGAPGSGIQIRVRGVSSIQAGLAPLYIVDGVQVAPGGFSGQASTNVLGGINPNDIESIEVLKDAAAAAIYGAQAANGVVLVTTKRGKSGKGTFTFNMTQGVVQPIRLYDVLNGPQYAALKREASLNDLTPTPTSPTPSLSLIEETANGSNLLYGDPNNSNVTNFNWVDAVFRNAIQSAYNLTYSGGDDKTRFYFSGSYEKQEGQILRSQWNRGQARFNIEHKATPKLLIKSNTNISVQTAFGDISGGNGNFINSPFFGAFTSAPTRNAFLPDGRFAEYTDGVLAFNYNIIQGVNEEFRRGSGIQGLGNLQATYNISPELSVTGFVGVDFINRKDNNRRPTTIAAFRATGGDLFEVSGRILNYNANATLNYNKRFNDIHTISGLLGYEYRANQEEFASVTGRGVLPQLTLLGSVTTPFAVNGGLQEYDRAGAFGQIKYDYNDRYFVDFTLRRDGSSRFGENNKWGTFYAGSVAWRISQEDFMADLKSTIDELKVRASYGKVGNSEIFNYDNQTTVVTNNNSGEGSGTLQYNGVGGRRINAIGNNEITWENNFQTNIGVDFGLFQNSRVFGSVDLWRKDTRDALLSVQFLQDAGLRNSAIRQNVGEIRNQGVDIELGANILTNTEGLTWTTSFNITFQKNEVTQLTPGQPNLVTVVGGNFLGTNQVFKGRPIGAYYVIPYAGVNPATGQAMYYDARGNIVYQPETGISTNEDLSIDFNDNRYVGSAIPTYFGGWNNTFGYKRFTLDFQWQFNGGNVAFNADYFNNMLNGMQGGNNNVTAVLERWQKPGDITNQPRLSLNRVYNGVSTTLRSSRYIEDASYIRFKVVTLAYTLPLPKTQKIIQSVRIFAQAFNLATITRTNLIDPEVVATTTNPSSGLGGLNQYPQGRLLQGGITVQF